MEELTTRKFFGLSYLMAENEVLLSEGVHSMLGWKEFRTEGIMKNPTEGHDCLSHALLSLGHTLGVNHSQWDCYASLHLSTKTLFCGFWPLFVEDPMPS